MERLTRLIMPDYHGYERTPCTFCPRSKNCNKIEALCLNLQYYNRLAAYEDTLYTPSDISDMHNELCLKCGKYKTAHEGSCDGCRWHKKGE